MKGRVRVQTRVLVCDWCRVHDVSLSRFDGGSREQAVAVFSRTVKLLGGGVSAVGCAAVFDVIAMIVNLLGGKGRLLRGHLASRSSCLAGAGLEPSTVKLLGGGVSAVGCAAVCDVISVSSSCLVA